jgi:hypothetical protein
MIDSLPWNLAKWLGLLLELYSLFFLVNAALFIPYPYDLGRAGLVACGLFSSWLFALLSACGTVRSFKMVNKKGLIFSLPFAIWIIVVGCTGLSLAFQAALVIRTRLAS